MRRVARRRLQRSLDQGGNLIVADRARAARSRFVKQAITAILQKSAAPLANGVVMDAEFGSHGLVLGKPSAHRRIARHRSDSDRATR